LSSASHPSTDLIGKQDLHVHTTMSDGDVPLEDLVQIASARGVTVGVADHVSSRNVRMFVSTRERLENYLSSLEAADVLISAELCWCDAFAPTVMEVLLERCDYLVGSNHGFALPDGSFGSPWWRKLPQEWAHRPHELMEIMVHNLCDMVFDMPIAIAAHSTLLPLALTEMERDPEEWWTEELEDRFIEAAVRAGVALEISNRYQLPHDRFLRKAKQAGAKFSLGSDGHHVHQVAQLGWSRNTALRVGITDADLFWAEPKAR
jgi:histidinol phosphatase-like PHP family hydrolase